MLAGRLHRYTFSELFGRDLSDPPLRLLHRQMLIDAVLNAVMVVRRTVSGAPDF